jgi:cell division protein FtsB
VYGPRVRLGRLRERIGDGWGRIRSTGPAGLVWAAAGLSILLAVLSLADARGLQTLRARRRDCEAKEQANRALREENLRLRQIARSLQEPVDRAALEREARRQLGWVKADEILFKFE